MQIIATETSAGHYVVEHHRPHKRPDTKNNPEQRSRYAPYRSVLEQAVYIRKNYQLVTPAHTRIKPWCASFQAITGRNAAYKS